MVRLPWANDAELKALITAQAKNNMRLVELQYHSHGAKWAVFERNIKADYQAAGTVADKISILAQVCKVMD